MVYASLEVFLRQDPTACDGWLSHQISDAGKTGHNFYKRIKYQHRVKVGQGQATDDQTEQDHLVLLEARSSVSRTHTREAVTGKTTVPANWG